MAASDNRLVIRWRDPSHAAAVEALLKAMPGRITRKVIRQTLRAEAKKWNAAAKKDSPRDTGAMQRAHSVRVTNRKGESKFTIGPTRTRLKKLSRRFAEGTDQDYYPPYVHYGNGRNPRRPWLKDVLARHGPTSKRTVVAKVHLELKRAQKDSSGALRAGGRRP